MEQLEFLKKGEMSYRRRCHWDCPHDLFYVPFHSWSVGAYRVIQMVSESMGTGEWWEDVRFEINNRAEKQVDMICRAFAGAKSGPEFAMFAVQNISIYFD